ncbi:GAF and ANTAR domain-containing protein [Mycetocola miduiensis]|uniref:ANTAR domain-containing protein n=1 Tax=Mycetocola miduiensis TaxID=995034 RepID=A0A1I4YBL5_9MICO|nr:GAF and ANTAR domain-containing protein [Mycetocola miduiensis]SFN35428.1 ANTAR domain-containing protein [Mycetocola miduiensis]
MPDAFAEAMDALTGPTPPGTSLAIPIADALPVSGVAISTMGDFLGNETLSASDALAARLDELQFDLGEGPCWDAFESRRPVLEPNLRQHPGGIWPAFSDAIRRENIGAIHAFPLFVGTLRLGAMDMYSIKPASLSEVQTRQGAAFARVVSRLVLHRALERAGGDPNSLTDTQFSRRTIHQATGMVLAQLDIPPDEARLVIQAHAFATGRTMQEIAEDIVDRRLNFSMRDSGIEESP